jgi:pimeloyl-ACP methyl ester carboxylesterase
VPGGQHNIVAAGRGRAGDPPVLLSSGLGGAWFDWRPVMDLLRDRYRVIAFDRPGLGGSPPGWAAPTLAGEAARLAELAGLAAPGGGRVVVAAHSWAAFHAEALARTRPDLVAGLVFVDPSCESAARPRRHLSPLLVPFLRGIGALAGASGAARLLGPPAHGMVMRRISGHPPAPPAAIRAVYGRGSVVGAALVENATYGEMAGDLVALRRVRPFPEIPLTVLTALGGMRSAARRRAWIDCHRRLAWMSPYGRQVTVDGAGHLLQADRPEAVAEAVAGLITKIKSIEIGSRP